MTKKTVIFKSDLGEIIETYIDTFFIPCKYDTVLLNERKWTCEEVILDYDNAIIENNKEVSPIKTFILREVV